MSSRDPDDLYLEAVRHHAEQPAGDDRERNQLQRIGEIARSLDDEDMRFDDPPPRVWDAIAERVGITEAADVKHEADESAVQDIPPAPASQPWRGRRLLALAAVVLLLAAAAASAIVILDTTGDGPTTVASAQLEPLTDVEPAEVRLIERDRRLHLDLPLFEDNLPPTPGYYEVWLLDPAVEGMISLGPLRADGVYDLPPNIDHRAYPTVDISREPDDGDPTHSGDSVLRGTLDA